jgi:hypothetical protein
MMYLLFTGKECIEPESSKNIFHINNRIIDEFPDSDRKTSEYHDIDSNSENIEHDR